MGASEPARPDPSDGETRWSWSRSTLAGSTLPEPLRFMRNPLQVKPADDEYPGAMSC